MSTRTEQGYALWKEDPQTVAEARTAATGLIATRKIKEGILAPFVSLLLRLERKMAK